MANIDRKHLPEKKSSSLKTNISKSLRRTVWLAYFGKKYEASCPCCCTVAISVFDFECGHIIAEAHGGATDVSNLIPICKLCNTSSGTRNLLEYKDAHFKNAATSAPADIAKLLKKLAADNDELLAVTKRTESKLNALIVMRGPMVVDWVEGDP
jgi:hypothetical protein